MKKTVLFIFISCIISACTTDDNQPSDEEQANILVVKNIHKETTVDGYFSDYIFNSSGRLDSIERVNPFNTSPTEYAYNTNNQLDTEHIVFGTETLTSQLNYTGNSYSSISQIGLAVNFQSDFVINNNSLTYSIPNYEFTAEAEVIITFDNDQLENITAYQINRIELGSSTIWSQQSFSYDSNGNLASYEKIYDQGDEVNEVYTFTFDNNINPFAESMNIHATSYVIINTYYGISIDKLLLISPNNIIYNSFNNSRYTYDYNEFNYPVSASVSDIISNEVSETITYTYY